MDRVQEHFPGDGEGGQPEVMIEVASNRSSAMTVQSRAIFMAIAIFLAVVTLHLSSTALDKYQFESQLKSTVNAVELLNFIAICCGLHQLSTCYI